MLSAHTEDEYVDHAREVGAVGYVAKQISAESLTRVIHEVATGHSLCHPVKSARAASEEKRDTERGGVPRNRVRQLTFRESEVLGLMAGGLPKTQIAARLRISRASLERLFGTLMGKLSISSIANLLAYAVAFGCDENDVELVIT